MSTRIPFQHYRFVSDAISLSSPSGRVSKRQQRESDKRLHAQLFDDLGPEGLKGEAVQPTEMEQCLRQAARLRDLAARGMSTRKFNREAAKMEARAAELLKS